MGNSIRDRILKTLGSFVFVVVCLFIVLFSLYLSYSLRQQLTNTLVVQSNNAASNIEYGISTIQSNLARLAKSDVVINTIIDVRERDQYISKVFDNFDASNNVLATELYNYNGSLIYDSKNESHPSVSTATLLVALELGKEQIVFDEINGFIMFVTPIKYYETTQAALATYIDFTALLLNQSNSQSDLTVSYYINDLLFYRTNNKIEDEKNAITVFSDNRKDLFLSDMLGLSVSVGISKKSFLEPVYTALKVLFLIGVVMLIVAYLVGNILAKRLANPIVSLAKSISQPYEGVPPKCAPLGTNDELEVLAQAFDARSQALLDATMNLKKEVKQHEVTQAYLLDLREKLEHLVDARTQDLKKKTVELEEANKIKSLFLASMSHELRTPLNSIIGFTNIILKRKSDGLDDSIIDALTTVNRCGHTLHSLVNDILDLSKIEAGKMETDYQWFDLSSFLFELKESFRFLTEEKNISFEVRVNVEKCKVFTDEKLLKQVFSNLISNAIKYTNQGGVTIILDRADVGSMPAGVTVSIKDTGIGISDKDQITLFDDFTRVFEKVNDIEGTGLGLSIVSKLIELLGLDLEVESIVDKGSVFSVHLPSKIVADEG